MRSRCRFVMVASNISLRNFFGLLLGLMGKPRARESSFLGRVVMVRLCMDRVSFSSALRRVGGQVKVILVLSRFSLLSSQFSTLT